MSGRLNTSIQDHALGLATAAQVMLLVSGLSSNFKVLLIFLLQSSQAVLAVMVWTVLTAWWLRPLCMGRLEEVSHQHSFGTVLH
jgi:hypothetical protein